MEESTSTSQGPSSQQEGKAAAADLPDVTCPSEGPPAQQQPNRTAAPPAVPLRTIKTLSLYLTFFALGMAANVVGPTLVTMEVLLRTDTKSSAVTYTCGSLGYTLGSVCCGLIYDRVFSRELLFIVAAVGMGAFLAVAPFSTSLYVFVALITVQNCFMGVIDTGGQSYMLSLWPGHKYKEAALQAAHSIWSVGSTVGPFIVQPFLPELRASLMSQTEIMSTQGSYPTSIFNDSLQQDGNLSTSGIYSGNCSSGNPDLTFNCTGGHVTERYSNRTSGQPQIRDIENVRYSYVLIGSLVMLSSFLFIFTFFRERLSCLGSTAAASSAQKDLRAKEASELKEDRGFKWKMLFIMFWFYFVYLMVEFTPGNFSAVFVIKGLGWPNPHGPYIVSTLWGAHGFSRMLGVPLSTILRPCQMLVGDLVIVAAGFLLLLFSHYHHSIVWIGTAMAGFGMGTMFASGVLFASEYIQITGSASAVLLVGASAGGILGPLLTGYILQVYTPMAYVYILLGTISAQIATFIAAYIFTRKYGKPLSLHVDVDSAVEMAPLKIEDETEDKQRHTDRV